MNTRAADEIRRNVVGTSLLLKGFFRAQLVDAGH
jgi:hypothetical protein